MVAPVVFLTGLKAGFVIMEGYMRQASRLLHEIQKPSTYSEIWANFMRDKLCVMTKQKSQNLLLEVDPLSTIRNNKFITQGEKFTGNRDSEGESFCIEY